MIIFINNKSTEFCQITLHILKDLFIKEKWFLFSASRCVYFTSRRRLCCRRCKTRLQTGAVPTRKVPAYLAGNRCAGDMYTCCISSQPGGQVHGPTGARCADWPPPATRFSAAARRHTCERPVIDNLSFASRQANSQVSRLPRPWLVRQLSAFHAWKCHYSGAGGE